MYRIVRKWVAAITVGVAILVSSGEGARASDEQSLSDVRCVVVGLRMIQANDEQQSAAGMMLAAYYLGRLDGRSRDGDSERLIKSEAQKMTLAEFRFNATRCGKALEVKGKQIQRAGTYLSSQSQDDSSRR